MTAFKTLLTSLLLVVPLPALGKNVPFDGPIQLTISVVKGIEAGQEANPQETPGELDGTILEVGTSQCTLVNGSCTVEHVMPGPHSPGIFLRNSKKGIAYRFVGTSAGPIIQVRRSESGALSVLPQDVPLVIFKLERYYSDEQTEIATLPPALRYQGVKVDPSLKIELWLHIVDESEGVSYQRRPHEDELRGVILRLGKATCKPVGSSCVFERMGAGRFTLDGEFPNLENARLSLDPGLKPVDIEYDWWTKRPKVKDRRDTFTVTINKTIIRTGKQGKF